MTHEIKTAPGNRLLTAVLMDDEDLIDIGDIEDLERLVEEARAYAASLLDRIWSLGQELERVRIALHSGGLDVERLRAAIDGHVSEECPFDACFGECARPISDRYARLPAEVER